MTNLPYKIHERLTEARRQAPTTDLVHQPEVTNSSHLNKKVFLEKEYPRMSKIKLPDPIDPEVTLLQTLKRRRSSHEVTKTPLSLQDLSYILSCLGLNDRGTKTYPSGGGLYPIETYLLARRVDGLEVGAYHYHTTTHALEHLWTIPEKLEMFGSVNTWAEDARALLIFTGIWYKNSYKYKDFSYLLGTLETGHAGQNAVLAAAALNIPACPLAGFNDDVAVKLLDLNPNSEQPVYCIALG